MPFAGVFPELVARKSEADGDHNGRAGHEFVGNVADPILFAVARYMTARSTYVRGSLAFVRAMDESGGLVDT